MAVASQNADNTERSQTTGEPSGVASDSSSRFDSPTSSPNRVRDSDPQTLKSEEYRQLFRLPPEEVLVQDFNCALQENILLQGHMYMFGHYICFYSNIFGFETKKIIPFHEVTCVRKAKMAAIFPTAIEIVAGCNKYFFGSFLSRDEAFKLINDGFLEHGAGAKNKIVTNEKLESEPVTQSNDIIEMENVNSSNCPVNEIDLCERSEDGPAVEDSKLQPSGQYIVAETLSEVLDNSGKDLEAVSNSISSSLASQKIIWRQGDSDAPRIPEYYAKVSQAKFPIKVEEFFTLFFSDDAVNFVETYHKSCGDKDFRCTSWSPHENFGHARDISFQHPIKLFFGARFGSCQEIQKFRIFRNSHLVIETLQEIGDAPYGEYFRVEGLWDVERNDDELGECCVLTVYVNVSFSKTTIWKGKIELATKEECRDACAIWINIANELLKQRNLQKRVGPKSSTIQNGVVEAEMEAESEGHLDTSQLTADCAEISQVASDFEDINHGIGNLNNVTSLVSSLREYIAKPWSSLKSQNQASLLLVIIFAVIFLLMQLSIVALLCRPQHVHLTFEADYGHEMGSGTPKPAPETAAWLERQIHHLKDEMLMVETRLENMRCDHDLLKSQLQKLELWKQRL